MRLAATGGLAWAGLGAPGSPGRVGAAPSGVSVGPAVTRPRRRPLAGGAFVGARVAARGSGGVVFDLLLEPGHLVACLLQVLRQSPLAVERGSAGAHAHAVLGAAVEIDQTLRAKHGHGVRQQVVQEFDVRDAEIGAGMVVDGDATANPAEGVVVGTQPGQRACGADPFAGGVQPLSLPS